MTRLSGSPSPKISPVVSDFNGTPVTDQKLLTDPTKAAVRALHRRGIIFSNVSAPSLRMVLDAPVAMFKQAGLSIVMCNPAPAVCAADVVTDSNARTGFAHAIERFILGGEQSSAVVNITRAGAVMIKDVGAKISLVLADVDGTLVTADKVLTARAVKAVGSLRASGVGFAITSGRPPRGMEMLIKPLDLRTPIAGFNGGIFVRPDMSVLEQHLLAPEAATRADDIMRSSGLDVWVYSGNDWYVRDLFGPHVAREQWTVKFAPTVVEDFEKTLASAVKIVGVSDDLDLVARCEKAIQDALGAAASAARSQPYYLDVTNPDANKGTVVTTLSKMLSVPVAEIATIGDMPNDVLMFRKSGVSIAMGNASPDVQRQADFVTASYNDEGFAKAIERFILHRAAESGSEAR